MTQRGANFWADVAECRTGNLYTNLRGGWSADATLRYDRKGDGLGEQKYQFAGTPYIR